MSLSRVFALPRRPAAARWVGALAAAAAVLAAGCSGPGTEASIEEVEARPADSGSGGPSGGAGAEPASPEPGAAAGVEPSEGPAAPGAAEPGAGAGATTTGSAGTGGATVPGPAGDDGTLPGSGGTGAAGTGATGGADPGTAGGANGGAPVEPPITAGGGATGGGTGGVGPLPVDETWLRTEGNRILTATGERWRARGATVHDTRGCGACTGRRPSPEGVMRRIDVLVDQWGANLVRLALESHPRADGRTHWKSLIDDAQYLADVERIVAHALGKRGVYVMLTLWKDPSLAADGWPSPSTADTWRLLAARFAHEPRVIYGLSHEPTGNFGGSRNAEAWAAMNDTVGAIREVEARFGTRRHLVAVQGTDYRAKHLDTYVTRPIEAGGGENVVYEVHVRSSVRELEKLVEIPARTLPVIIGSFGPSSPSMTESDSEALMARARLLDIPHVASTFHEGCGPEPRLVTVTPKTPGGDVCGPDVTITPTRWGELLMKGLAAPR